MEGFTPMPANSFASLCDDFFVDLYVNTELDLPTERDTVLTFFDRIHKQFPTMGRFLRRENNEYYLEEDHNSGHYRWVSLEGDRIGVGVCNPLDFDEVYIVDRLVLELMPYMLGVSPLDVDSLDLAFAMDFDCAGSHDEIIADALFGTSAFGSLFDVLHAKPIVFSPAMVIAISEDQRTQARISIESKTSVYEPGDKETENDDAISLSLTIRQYPRADERFDALVSFEQQCQIAESMMIEKIVPYFVHPLTEVIAQRRST
jgi:hypothetical protein